MRAATVHQLPVTPRAPPAARESGSRRSTWIAGLVALVALLVAAGYALDGEGRALRRLPPEERAAVYARTFGNLASVCSGDGRRELRDFCRGQADFALEFPECDRACADLAYGVLRSPPR